MLKKLHSCTKINLILFDSRTSLPKEVARAAIKMRLQLSAPANNKNWIRLCPKSGGSRRLEPPF